MSPWKKAIPLLLIGPLTYLAVAAVLIWLAKRKTARTGTRCV